MQGRAIAGNPRHAPRPVAVFCMPSPSLVGRWDGPRYWLVSDSWRKSVPVSAFACCANFETMSMAAQCATLHPMRRLMLWLSAIGDRRMVLTDIARESAEYAKMGVAA